MKAIILAGGLGTRLRPLTDNTPKPLLPVCGKPILSYSLENLKAYKITDITLAISYHADMVKDYYGDGSRMGVSISYSVEEEPLGTGGAVLQASKGFTEDFVLAWGDNICDVNLTEMMRTHKESQGLITMALTKREDVEHFGVAQLEGNKMIGFVEKPRREDAPSKLINAGVFVISPEALKILPRRGKSSIERECFEHITRQGNMYAHIHTGYWYTTDTIEKLHEAQQELAKKSLKNISY